MAHVPVLLQATLDYLLPDGAPAERIVDGTLGAGGHTRALIERGAGHVLAFDRDAQAIQIARSHLGDLLERVTIIHDSYLTMRQHAAALGWDAVDGVLLDLGLSSMQLDTPERGFAFKHDAPLDMRFDPSQGQTAADILNTWAVDALADIFYQYGEERHSRLIARKIAGQRPITTTRQLADLVAEALPRPKRSPKGGSSIHPATRVFQALRIAVNDELNAVEQALPVAMDLLRPGARLAVITFHSLEDRIVKQAFKAASTEIVAPPGMASIEEKAAIVDLVTRKPVMPDADEIAANPRSRSAKLRVVQKRQSG